MSTSFTDGLALQPFVKMMDTIHDLPSLVELINQVLSAPSVYVFGEILEHVHFQQILNASHQGKLYLKLVEIFAYGTFDDYKALNLPSLSTIQELKLKHLSLISLASQSRSIPYSLISEKLGMASVRAIEDLIIENMNIGLSTGKLNPAQGTFEVDVTFGRDVNPSYVHHLEETLTSWCEKSRYLLDKISEKIVWSSSKHEEASRHKKHQKDLNDSMILNSSIMTSTLTE